MSKSKKMTYSQIVEPAILDVVEDLNRLRLRTVTSCAGHPGKGERTGYIVFGRKYSHSRIKKVLGEHGLDVTSIYEERSPYYLHPKTIVEFKALGGEQFEDVYYRGGRYG